MPANVPPELEEKFKSCKDDLIAQGYEESSAYAICYTSVVEKKSIPDARASLVKTILSEFPHLTSAKTLEDMTEKDMHGLLADYARLVGAKARAGLTVSPHAATLALGLVAFGRKDDWEDYGEGSGGAYASSWPTSLEALAEQRNVEEQARAIRDLTNDYSMVVNGIVYSPEIPDKAAAIAKEAGVFASMMLELSKGVNAVKARLADLRAQLAPHNALAELSTTLSTRATKTGWAFDVFKANDGEYYGLGVFTNKYQDLQDEIIEDAAHKEFAAHLDAFPAEAPELWTWHTKGTARKNRACWWDYTDNGFFWMMWKLTKKEAHALKDVGPLKMSHQFNGLRGGKFWKYYRTFEATILPEGEEANPYTPFGVQAKEIVSMKGFTPERRAFLAKIHGEDAVKQLEENEEKTRKALEAAGVPSKALGKKEEDAQAEADTEDKADTTASTDESVGEHMAEIKTAVTASTEAMAKLTDAMSAIMAQITAIEGRVKSLEASARKSDDERIAWLTSPRNAPGSSLLGQVPDAQSLSEDESKALQGATWAAELYAQSKAR